MKDKILEWVKEQSHHGKVSTFQIVKFEDFLNSLPNEYDRGHHEGLKEAFTASEWRYQIAQEVRDEWWDIAITLRQGDRDLSFTDWLLDQQETP